MARICCSYRAAMRGVAVFFVLAFIYANYLLYNSTIDPWAQAKSYAAVAFDTTHPIAKLMADARRDHERVLSERRTHSLQSTAARYRSLRGRNPPPGFDKWVEAALAADAVIVEEFFDRIYKDLAPFWGVDALTLAKRASASHFVVKVRRGKVALQGLDKDRVPWMQLWSGLLGEFAEHMPDVDMPVNMMDESRVIVPHETIASLVKEEMSSRKIVPAQLTTTNYTGLRKVDDSKLDEYDPPWQGGDKFFWDVAVTACGPSTPAHQVPAFTNFTSPAQMPRRWNPGYAYRGFVRNWTAALDPCMQPHVRQLHGSLFDPTSMSVTQELAPLFGGSKLPLNNEILIPGAMYLTDDEFYSGGDSHGLPWDQKRNGLIWRGVDSGGHARNHSWHHLHRHRLVDMLNGTVVARVEATGERAPTFDLPPRGAYASRLREQGRLGAWIERFADAGFVGLCEGCAWVRQHMREVPKMAMRDQFAYKFLPDMDGNSFSARYRGFLRSTSVPLKASLYAEWHDDRLVPWLHFVPLDMTLRDLYPALEYFAGGDDASGPGDEAARTIAEQGRMWAGKALRREDMRLYLWRLLLEWARLCDENRETLGFIDDL